MHKGRANSEWSHPPSAPTLLRDRRRIPFRLLVRALSGRRTLRRTSLRDDRIGNIRLRPIAYYVEDLEIVRAHHHHVGHALELISENGIRQRNIFCFPTGSLDASTVATQEPFNPG
jgi:hypothetical protein